MRVLRLDLEYDGGGFAGWAVQPGLRTVEGTLAKALETLLREPVRLRVAGRTDAGVRLEPQRRRAGAEHRGERLPAPHGARPRGLDAARGTRSVAAGAVPRAARGLAARRRRPHRAGPSAHPGGRALLTGEQVPR